MAKGKIKIKVRAPRNPHVRDMISKPKKSGAHKDLKKEASRQACNPSYGDSFDAYLAKKLEDPKFREQYNKEQEDIERLDRFEDCSKGKCLYCGDDEDE